MKSALFLAPLLMLGGCITLLPKAGPAPHLYVLDAGEVARLDGAALPAVVGVGEPEGPHTLLSDDLAWRSADQLAFVNGTKWATDAQDSLQTLVMETLARQGRVRAAVRIGEARADYEVHWDVITFDVDEASMQARFVANVHLLKAAGGQVVASQMISTQQPVAGRSASGAAQSLTRAAREGGARIGAFVVDAIAADQASAASISR